MKQKTRTNIMFSIFILLIIFIWYLIICPGHFNKQFEKMLSDDDGYVATQVNVKFTNYTAEILYTNWDENLNNEYNACLNFKIDSKIDDSGKYMVDHNYLIYEQTQIIKGESNYVKSAECNQVDIHNHPITGCKTILWNGDIESAKQSYERGATFFMIQCDRDKVEVYTREDMLNGVIIKISENVIE